MDTLEGFTPEACLDESVMVRIHVRPKGHHVIIITEKEFELSTTATQLKMDVLEKMKPRTPIPTSMVKNAAECTVAIWKDGGAPRIPMEGHQRLEDYGTFFDGSTVTIDVVEPGAEEPGDSRSSTNPEVTQRIKMK